jgi:hypothetical protein
MSNEDPNAPVTPTRRSPRQGAGGSPIGSTVSIVLAVVAAVAGFLILNNITDDGGSSAGGDIETPDSVVDGGVDGPTATTAPTSTTEPPLVTTGATVVVANASGVGGSAGRMTEELAGANFEMVTPAINSTLPVTEETVVQYDPSVAASQAVAESVARVMGGLRVEPVSTPPAVDGGNLNGAGVLVLLGTNEADQTLAQLGATTASVDPTGGTTSDSTPDSAP